MSSTSAEKPSAGSSGIWTVHSETDGKPGLRSFAKSKLEAETAMARLKADDQDARAEYWLVELSDNDLADFRAAGMVPEGI